MEKALEELSASALRNLLIQEIKVFIVALDFSSTEELQAMKYRLRTIFDRIAENERVEVRSSAGEKNPQKFRGLIPIRFSTYNTRNLRAD